MMAWPTPCAAERQSMHLAGPWHRDDSAAARSIARWEDDGGRVGPPDEVWSSTSRGSMLPPPDARQS
jgi:hypothetical protein